MDKPRFWQYAADHVVRYGGTFTPRIIERAAGPAAYITEWRSRVRWA